MVTINYQSYGTKGFNLRLRFYQNGETKFIAVNKLLKGDLQSKHWNQKKQKFIPSAPFSEENNAILVEMKQRYDKMAISWQGSLEGFLLAMQEDDRRSNSKTFQGVIDFIIDDMKKVRHDDGTIKGTYENYIKIKKRVAEYCEYKHLCYDKLLIVDITPAFVNGMIDWVITERGGKGKIYISKELHAVLARADKEGWFDMQTVKNCKWQKKARGSVEKYNTLSSKQCKKFVRLKASEMPKNPKSELYRDFCTFILFTGQSLCDAATLQYKDIMSIGGVDHFVFKRRKISDKQTVPCAVPINSIMREIMDRWKKLSKDGYIFPIRSKEKLAKQKTNNGDIKHFLGRLNNWLKKIGKILECDFSLSTYNFRHTAITHYISKGVPTLYVANMMGTSVENCERIYYNNQGDTASRDKVLEAIRF